MNFENLPFIDKSWGVVLVLVVIILSMISMYVWLMMKGWTGDLLKVKSSQPSAEETEKKEQRKNVRDSLLLVSPLSFCNLQYNQASQRYIGPQLAYSRIG